MFSNLRTNSQIFILHKDITPYVEIGLVVSVSPPKPKYLVGNYLTPLQLVVDIVVSVNGNNITLQSLPANLDVADQGTINSSLFITTSRDAMNTEINTIRLKSLDIINSMEQHKKTVQDCELLLLRLNPEFAELKLQKLEIDTLKSLMSEIMSSMKELMLQLKGETKLKD